MIAFPLFVCASVLLFLAVLTLGKLDYLVSGVLCGAACYGTIVSRRKVAVVVSIVGAGLLYLVLASLFLLLGGAIYSR